MDYNRRFEHIVQNLIQICLAINSYHFGASYAAQLVNLFRFSHLYLCAKAYLQLLNTQTIYFGPPIDHNKPNQNFCDPPTLAEASQ